MTATSALSCCNDNASRDPEPSLAQCVPPRYAICTGMSGPPADRSRKLLTLQWRAWSVAPGANQPVTGNGSAILLTASAPPRLACYFCRPSLEPLEPMQTDAYQHGPGARSDRGLLAI